MILQFNSHSDFATRKAVFVEFWLPWLTKLMKIMASVLRY